MDHSGLMFPKHPKRKKRKQHKKGIIHDQGEKQCLLCMIMDNDFGPKRVHDHHIFGGTANRRVSEAEGLHCNLCIDRHHEDGPEAVHRNRFNNVLLKIIGQQIYEQTHTRAEFIARFGKSFAELEDKEVNKVVLSGRLTRDPEIRYTAGNTPLAIARYTLAVDRRFKKDGEASADFIQCVSFGQSAEFAERYFKKGTKITISGRIQTGSYTNQNGHKVYTTEVVIEEQEFAESKKAGTQGVETSKPAETQCENGFMNIPEGLEEELPFE